MPYFVYILSNRAGTVLYTGITNDLVRRVEEHRLKLVPGFTSKYSVNRLVYYEVGDDVLSVIAHEKAIKGGSRRRKIELIESTNPDGRDLSDDL
jgi:putative endonuclease